MTLVDKRMLIADGLCKWLWTYRGMNLFAQSKKGKIELRLSRRGKKGNRLPSLKIMELEETTSAIFIPSSKELDKKIELQGKEND